MEYKKLSECADFRNERTKQIDFETYISTENMLPNKAGVSTAESLPDVKTTTKYLPKDILLSNIRPYFKKIWFSNREGGCSNDVLVVTAKQGVNPNYLYYVLSDNNFFNYDTITSKGTKMPRGTPKAIMKYLVPDVDKDYQDKIVFILSRYDSLIENNNKRIKALEQMAENLYKEWFVRFRFPGHENAEFENGIPKGWELKRIGDLVQLKSGYAFKSEWWIEEGVPVIKIKDIESNTINLSDLSFVSKVHAEKSKLFFVNPGDLLIALTGATIGKIGLVPYCKNILTVNQRVGKFFLGKTPCESVAFWFCMFQQTHIQEHIIAIASSNAAQPNISPFDIERIRIPYNKDVVDKFNKKVQPFVEQILDIRRINHNLVKQRDLLLPRLMSGKLEV